MSCLDRVLIFRDDCIVWIRKTMMSVQNIHSSKTFILILSSNEPAVGPDIQTMYVLLTVLTSFLYPHPNHRRSSWVNNLRTLVDDNIVAIKKLTIDDRSDYESLTYMDWSSMELSFYPMILMTDSLSEWVLVAFHFHSIIWLLFLLVASVSLACHENWSICL